jgi:hypothetical protein
MTTQPEDPHAELAVIGGALLSPTLLADLTHMVTASDFARPTHRSIFAAIERRHRDRDPIDAAVIGSDCAEVQHARAVLADALTSHSSTQATLTHARRIADLAAVRNIAAAASQTLTRISDDMVHDPALLLDEVRTDLDTVTIPNDPRPPEGLWVAADLLSADFPEPPWVAEGLLRETWRLLFVGVEGGGKSTMLRQIVTAIACGVHPFTRRPIPPKPGLIVDVENPPSVVRDGLRMMPPEAADADLMVLSRPEGIDIRQRRDREWLHRAFAVAQPKIASIGPLYKLYRPERGESDEQAAVAAQNVLDELRVTYGCAMVLETHAPKGGAIRELIPFGSSAWMRWPELGWKLLPCDQAGNPADPERGGTSIQLGRFRGDRVQVDTPRMFQRSKGWPWAAVWDHNVYRQEP